MEVVGSTPGRALLPDNLRQVVNTLVYLLSSSVICCRHENWEDSSRL